MERRMERKNKTKYILERMKKNPVIFYMLSVQFSHSVGPDSLWSYGLRHQDFLSITIHQSLLKLMSIESVMPSNHLNFCRPLSSCLQSFPASGSFAMSQFFASGGQSTGASASASVLPMNIQEWFSLELISSISLQSKGLSKDFNTTVRRHQFSGAQPFLLSSSHSLTQLLEKP